MESVIAFEQDGAGAKAAEEEPATRRMLLAGAIGNVLEWYDFAAYGFLAIVFAHNFFPTADRFLGLISAFGVFAASFLMRPLGGAIFGHIGDHYGRRLALFISAGVMTFSTVAIGLLPTYAQAGGLAPLMLLLLRLAQGLSVGGEFTASTIFLGENAGLRWRGFFTSFASAGATTGTLLGSAVGAAVTTMLSPEAVLDWGWRIPFLLGIVLGGFIIVLRRGLGVGVHKPPTGEPPLVQAFRYEWRNMLRAVALNVMLGAGFYTLFVYLTTYMHQVDGLPERQSLQINTVSMVVLLLLTPVAAALSDVVGRKKVLVTALVALMLLCWPLFRMLSSGVEHDVLLGQLAFAVLMAGYAGPLPVVLVEMFQQATRCSAVSVAFNLALGIAGGTAPMVAVYLVNREKSDMGPAVYLIVMAGISLLAALTLTDRARRPLL